MAKLKFTPFNSKAKQKTAVPAHVQLQSKEALSKRGSSSPPQIPDPQSPERNTRLFFLTSNFWGNLLCLKKINLLDCYLKKNTGKINQLSILFRSFSTTFVSEKKLYFSAIICPNLEVFLDFSYLKTLVVFSLVMIWPVSCISFDCCITMYYKVSSLKQPIVSMGQVFIPVSGSPWLKARCWLG